MGKIKIMINGFICERCKHVWPPRIKFKELKTGNIKEKPIICPKCKSAYWDKPKKNENGG